jgi:hypothetical protein
MGKEDWESHKIWALSISLISSCLFSPCLAHPTPWLLSWASKFPSLPCLRTLALASPAFSNSLSSSQLHRETFLDYFLQINSPSMTLSHHLVSFLMLLPQSKTRWFSYLLFAFPGQNISYVKNGTIIHSIIHRRHSVNTEWMIWYDMI